MSNNKKASEKETSFLEIFENFLKNLPSAEREKDQNIEDLEHKQSLEHQRQRAEINQIIQLTALQVKFTRAIFCYLIIYTFIVVGTVWWFLFFNPQMQGVHYILVALIGSLTVGLFSCVRALATGIFEKNK